MSGDQNSLASRRKEGGYPWRYLTDAQRRGRAVFIAILWTVMWRGVCRCCSSVTGLPRHAPSSRL